MTSIYHAFKKTGDSARERIGDSDEFSQALGHVMIGFGWLEETICKHIAELMELSSDHGDIVTAEMSFKVRVHVLSSLVRDAAKTRKFNVGNEVTLEVWSDIVRMLFSCEELRNRVLHSSYHRKWYDMKNPVRRKTSAKASRGLKREEEKITASVICDVYDYALNVMTDLDEFFLV